MHVFSSIHQNIANRLYCIWRSKIDLFWLIVYAMSFIKSETFHFNKRKKTKLKKKVHHFV